MPIADGTRFVHLRFLRPYRLYSRPTSTPTNLYPDSLTQADVEAVNLCNIAVGTTDRCAAEKKAMEFLEKHKRNALELLIGRRVLACGHSIVLRFVAASAQSISAELAVFTEDSSESSRRAFTC